MAFRDALKKYREAQGYQAPASNTSTEDEKKNGSEPSVKTGTSFRDKLKKYREEAPAKSLQDWGSAAYTFLLDIQNNTSKWHGETEYQSRYDRSTKLLGAADTWRKQYAGNEEAISYINSVVEAITEAQSHEFSTYQYFTKWGTEENYIKGATENWQQRQQRYESNKKRIEELEAERKQADAGQSARAMATGVYIPSDRVKEIDAEIERLKAENEQYERGEGGWAYKASDDNYAVTYKGDFDAGSSKRDYTPPTREAFAQYDAYADSSTWYWDADGVGRDAYGNVLAVDENGNWYNPKAEGFQVQDKLGLYLGTSDQERQEAAGYTLGTEGTWASIIKDGMDGSWEYLTETEVGIYYYYLSQSQERADQYLSEMKTELNRRATLDAAGKWDEAYEDATFLEKIAMNIATVPAKFISNIAGGIENAAYTLTGQDLNPYSAAQGGMHFSQSVRGNTAEELDKTGFKIPVVGFTLGDLYQTGMSRLDSFVQTAMFGGFGTIFLGMGAAQEEAYNLYQKGASAEQITLGAFAAGAAEAIWEYVSFGKLQEIKDVDTLGKWVKSILIQGANEASEEALTEVSNMITNALIMGSQSNLAEMYKENEEKAFRTFVDILQQVAHSAFGGFIGGVGAGFGQSTGVYIDTTSRYRQVGRDVMGAKGGANALLDLAMKKAGASTGDIAKSLTEQAGKVSTEIATGKGLKKVGAAMKNRSNATKIGRLYNTVLTADTAANQADIAKSLQRKGFSAETANDIAEALVAEHNGLELTDVQKKLLQSAKGNKVVQEAISSIMENEKSTMGQRSQQIRDFREDVRVGNVARDYGVSVDTIKKAKQGIYAPETEYAPEGKYEVSVEGKTILKSDPNKTVNIKKIASIENGRMAFETDDGTVDASDVSYATEDEALVYEAIARLGGIINVDDANRLVEGFSKAGDMSAAVYARGVAQAYTYGYYGYSMADALGKDTLSSKLTDSQRSTAFAWGRVQRKNDTDKAQEERAKFKEAAEKAGKTGQKGGVYFRSDSMEVSDIDSYMEKSGTVLKDVQKVSVETMKHLSEALGIDFVVYESYVKDGKRYYIDENGVEKAGAPNGWYDQKTGKVYIDLHAGNNGRGVMLFTIAHELTHFIHQWSPEKFAKLADIVFAHGKMKGNVAGLVAQKMRKAEARGKPISYAVAYEEVVADAMESILTSGRVMEMVADIKQQDRGLWQKICDWFKDLANYMKRVVAAYQGKDPDSVEGKMVAEMKGLIKEIEAIYAEGLVDASENFQSFMTMADSTDVMAVEDGTMYSYSSLAEAAGFVAVENADGTRSFTRNGAKVTKVTVEDIENSPIGALINFSLEKSDISKEDADRQKKMFADICTMACKTNDFAMTMQFVGSAVFTGMKANADKQYGTTYDFPSICTKTQAVIDAMSAKMVKLGRGLNSDEIIELYRDVVASGNPVPCPECYVFSRWIGIGGLLDNIKKYQDYYGGMDVADVAKAYLKMKAEVSKFAEEQGISFGKAKGALTSKLTKEYNKLKEKIEKAQNQGEKVKPADQKRLAELEPMMNTVKGMTWLENVYFADSSLKKVNPRFRVPDSVLFDLNNGEAFATQYKEAWAFRTTQGAGYGKAITPYAEAKLGEGILVTNNTTKTIKSKSAGTLDNYFLSQMGKLDKKAKAALERARLKQKIQAFIGGQRFQSTSDARYENASDYLLAALEMQAMGGMVQVYTKVDGAVPAFSAWGFSINQSLMPLGGGLDANGNVKDTGVGGMNPDVAFENRNKHESAGTITIGVNDNHIRAMFKQWVRDFIIPYHASGGKADVVAAFRSIQEGQEKRGKMVRSTDYSRTQSDKVLSDEVLRWMGKTDEEIKRIHQVRDARIAILTGGSPNMAVVNSNRFLSALYEKLHDGEWKGVKLAKSKVESQIFPNEFWDQTVSYEESGKITRDYLEYCDDLGFLHRFSGMIPSNGKLVPVNGYDQNGERVELTDLAYQYDENGQKTDQVEDFFWKVLTDRRMYDNEGNYLPQKVVTLNDTTTDTVTGFAKNNFGKEYNKETSDRLVKQIEDTTRFSPRASGSSTPAAINAKDVVISGNGVIAVNIDSKKSGLRSHRKGKWASVISEQIRKTLAGKSIIAADGDIITITNRGAGEVGYGTDSKNLRDEAKEIGDYSKVERKMFTAEHAASIISLSVYKSWSANTEDPTDWFKKDGLNHRSVILYIDGVPHEATVLTALSTDEKDIFNYGDKFYDIVDIKEQTNQSATSGDTIKASIPHTIMFADDSSDKLTVAQKQRVVNRQNATYSSGDTGGSTAIAAAFANPKKLKSERNDLTPEQQKHFDYNQKQATVGSTLKTLKGSAIKRSTKYGVGKEIGGEIYFHKDYAEEILPDEVLSQALHLLEENQPGFEYNCLKYNPKTGVVAFQEAPDFDAAREPVVGDYVSVNTNTGVVKTGHSNYIWHHKWNWVKNDYSGFDVEESWNWSKQWLSTLTEVSDGNGIERWNAQLDKFGLPQDGVMYSEREQEYDSKDTSVKILPATFTKFGLKSTDRVLDWGGGQYDIAKKAVEHGYPGIKFEVVDAFNRTKTHNDRILEEYKDNPATVLTINNVLNVIKETDIIEDVIRESKEYLAADGVCYIKIYEGNDVDGKTGNGKVTSSGWQNNQPATWYIPFAKKFYQYVEPVGDILVASDKPINKKALPKADKATAKSMRDKVAEIRKAEPSMRESLYSDRDDTPTFYSHMAKVVDGVKQEKLGAASVVSMLRGKGVKAEEIKWSGIEAWLEGKKSVTKAELQAFIAGSMLQIEEETLTDKARPYSAEHQKQLTDLEGKRDEIAKQVADMWKKISGKDFPVRNYSAGFESAVEAAIRDFNLDSKKASFQGKLVAKLRPGVQKVIENNDDFGFDSWKEALRSIHSHGKNFLGYYEMSVRDKTVINQYIKAREAFTALPNKITDADTKALREIAHKVELENRKIGDVKSAHYSEVAKHMTRWGRFKLPGGENYREVLFRIPGSAYTNDAMYTHWENRRGVLAHARIQDIDTSLGKMLFIEELQSDWHNEGHAKGYANSKTDAEIEELRSTSDERFYAVEDYSMEMTGSAGEWDTIEKTAKGAKLLREYREAKAAYDSAMDAAISKAPDAPFQDTYHEYVLKRLIRMAAEHGYDSIGWTGSDTQMGRWNPDRRTNAEMGVTGAKNPDAVAYEEAYRNVYDRRMKNFLSSFGKKWGTTVGTTILDNGTEVWSMSITDAMRESVVTEGQPLYQERSEDSVSNRSLLANAFEGVAQDQIEAQAIQEYKGIVPLLDKEERNLQRLNEQIKALSFGKGPRDNEKIRALRDEATKTANRIGIYDKQLLRLEASKPLQAVLDREKKAAYKRAEQKGKQALAEYKATVEAKQKQAAEEWREARKQAVAKVRETAGKREAREKLQKLVLDTVKWISYPAKTDVKCPDILKQPYADFLNGIDLSSKRLANGGDPTKTDLRMTNAMDSLATALDKIMTSQDPSTDVDKVLDTGYLDLPADFVQKLRDMTENIKAMMVDGDYVVNNMSAAEVRQLSQIIRTLNHAIKTMSKLYANLRFSNIEALGFDTMEFVDALGEIEKTGGVKDFVQWDNALPYYAFKRFGKGGESVFEALMDSQDKLAFLAQEIFTFQEKTWTGKEAKSWSEDTHTITLPNGNELTLTTADAMSVYCLSRREHAVPHLLGGGIRVMGIQKGSKKAKDSRSLLTIEDIDAIVSSLTDRQKQVAEAVQEFMSTVCSEWGNEISMKRFLTKEFTEKFYFPIESNDENLPTKDPAAQQSDLFRLLNISATKPLTEGANNEVIIRNIFDVFTGHASDMARLNAYGMGLLDYMKWLNYREKSVNEEGQINVRGVRKSMEKAYGKAANSYVLNLVKDVNGRPSDGGDPNILMKWMRTAKTASVGSSLRVATLQITSYPRASLVLSPKSLALGLTKMPKIDKAKKYCGIALWKSFGFYDTNISRSIEDQMKGVTDFRQKLIELSLKGAEVGDAITWGALWNACEYEVAATKEFKVGTEEFNQAVGKKLREVVYATQVVDSTLTRSQIMRSKRGMAQEAAAFMSEPTLSANILMDAGFQFNAEKRRTGNAKVAWRKTGAYVGRAIAVYAIGQLSAALLEGLWDAWRDEDDEEFWKKYLDAFVENLVLDLAPFNKIPIISDVFEAALAMFGVGFYSSDKMSTTWLTQAVSAADAWKEVIGGESSMTTYNAIYKTMRALSSFFGVSISGVMREGVALWNNTAGAYDSTLKIRTWDLSKTALAGEALDAIIDGNHRQAESIKAQFPDEDSYHDAMRTAIKERFAAGQIDSDTALQYLVDYAGMDEDDAYWKVQEWMYESETGDDYAKYGEFFTAVETGKNLKAVMKQYTDNGVTTEALATQITNHFKPIYMAMSTSERARLKGYLLNAYELCGIERADAEEKIAKWQFEGDHPELVDRITYAQYKRWETDGKPKGVSIDLFVEVSEYRDDGTSNSARSQEEVAAYINSLPISTAQKDALWCCFWKASTLKNAPWH